MNWDDVFHRTADMARPYGIYATSSALVVGPFIHGDAVTLGLTLTAFLALIGARGAENISQIKATAATNIATSQVITPDKVTTTTVGPQPAPPPQETKKP